MNDRDRELDVYAYKLLERACILLDTPEAWTQLTPARNEDDHKCTPESKLARKWCLTGAITRAASELNAYNEDTIDRAIQHVRDTLDLRPMQSLQWWNDEKDRQHGEIIDALRRARKAAYTTSQRARA